MNARLLEYARGYAEAGWPVFPLKPRDKVPATSHGCKDATTDVDRVVAWWRKHPDHNIGLATGYQFDVLDLDGDEGIESFCTWLEETGCALDWDDLPIANTGSGGKHLYLLPTGAGNRTHMLAKIDWRGRGGYVVAPPSTHPNGTQYRWHQDPVGYTVPPCPQELTELVNRTGGTADKGAASTNATVVYVPVRDSDGTSYGTATLRAICQEIANLRDGEGRNHRANAGIYRVYRLVAGGEIREAAADEYTRSALAALYPDRGDRYREGVWKSAKESGLSNPLLPRNDRRDRRGNGDA